MPWNRTDERNPQSPQPGYYAVKMVKGGVECAAQIGCTDGVWWAKINDKPHGEPSADPQLANGVQFVWLRARPVTENEHRFLLARYEWNVQHKPGSPFADPGKRVNLRVEDVIVAPRAR
jgi:hypothetical protein